MPGGERVSADPPQGPASSSGQAREWRRDLPWKVFNAMVFLTLMVLYVTFLYYLHTEPLATFLFVITGYAVFNVLRPLFRIFF